MKYLPDWIWGTPRLFYFMAALVFFASLGIEGYEYSSLWNVETTDTYRRVTYLRVLLNAGEKAVYLLGTGVWIHVSLAIYRHLAVPAPKESAE